MRPSSDCRGLAAGDCAGHGCKVSPAATVGTVARVRAGSRTLLMTYRVLVHTGVAADSVPSFATPAAVTWCRTRHI